MRKPLSAALFVVTMVLCSGMLAYGCGDKLLVMGRSVRLQVLFGNRSAHILAYQHAGTHGSDVIADSEFQSTLKNAGYQLRVVRDTEELEVALRLGKYDLLVGYRAGDMLAPQLTVTEALRVEAQHFVDCVRTGRRPLSDGESGLRVIRVLEAAERSLARGGEPTRLA